MAQAVSLHGVRKQFGTARAPVTVFGDLSLTVEPGEFLAVLGPSGCGKSTLLRLLAGLDRPSGGTLRLGGQPITAADDRCGVVFQEPRLLPWRTIADNVALGLRTRRPGRTGRVKIEALLAQVGLAEFAGAWPHQLSGGMAQRAGLARGLIGRPEVLLLDEPFAALDALTRLRMQDLLAAICADIRPTVVLVTHDVDEALALADRVVLLGPRPATVVATVPVPLPRPRRRDDPALLPLRGRILNHFGIVPSTDDSGLKTQDSRLRT